MNDYMDSAKDSKDYLQTTPKHLIRLRGHLSWLDSDAEEDSHADRIKKRAVKALKQHLEFCLREF